MVAVPDDYLRAVVFLCIDEPNESGVPRRIPKATGFFVRVRLTEQPVTEQPAPTVDYLVTARHCVEEAMRYEHLWVRWNLKAGGFIEVSTNCTDWITSNDSDVAAILMLSSILPDGVSVSDCDTTSLSMTEFVGPDPDYKYVGGSEFGPIEVQPRVGNEAYFLGLFTQQYGEERNLPIARFGHISRMPSVVEMKGPGDTRFKSVAYLMEFQSWGGNSGSRVFFLHPMIVEDQDIVSGHDVTTGVNQIHVSGFMGLVNAHFEIPKVADTEEDGLGEIQTALNSGIAMVTPADAVRQLLMREDVVEHREGQTRRLLDARKRG